MAKYRLLAPHYIGNQLFETGTEIDTSQPPFQEFKPSMHCEGLDNEGKKLAEKHLAEKGGEERRRDPLSGIPTTMEGGSVPHQPRPNISNPPPMKPDVVYPPQMSPVAPGSTWLTPEDGERHKKEQAEREERDERKAADREREERRRADEDDKMTSPTTSAAVKPAPTKAK